MNVYVLMITVKTESDVTTVVQGVFTDADKAHQAGLETVKGEYNYDFTVDVHCLQ